MRYGGGRRRWRGRLRSTVEREEVSIAIFVQFEETEKHDGLALKHGSLR
jgi:hypothetical protein